MALLEWSESLALGVGAMDATHREFVEQLNALHDARDEAFIGALDRLIEHTVAHFEQERGWMAAIDFPPMRCHTHEHDGVLDIMREVRRMVAEGKAHVGKVLTKELAPWFSNHAATMDATLAFFLQCAERGIDPMQELARRQQSVCAHGGVATSACAQATACEGAQRADQAGRTSATTTG